MIRELLLATTGLGLIAATHQTLKLRETRQDLAELQQAALTAATKGELRAAQAGQEAISVYVNLQKLSDPVATAVAGDLLAVRLCDERADGHQGVPTIPSGSQPSAKDLSADRRRLQEAGYQLQACAGELDLCHAQWTFHQRNTGRIK